MSKLIKAINSIDQNNYDIAISGAGPAGTACALALKDSGLKVALLDKAVFPRDKVCGDAIGGRVKTILNRIDPESIQALESFPHKQINTGWSLTAPNKKSAKIYFKKPGYISKRMDFDAFLMDRVLSCKNVDVLAGFQLYGINKNENGFTLLSKGGTQTIHTRLLIGCDGAHSAVARTFLKSGIDDRHYSAAVRAYYEDIEGILDPGIIEIILLKNYLPGYFWIFPLDSKKANVGFGMLSREIRRRKIDLKEAFYSILENDEQLNSRFKNAVQTGDLEGMGLPLGGKSRSISGDGFMLCGDAAYLIDPLNGEGIGNAMWSGEIAARHAVNCFMKQRFDRKFLKAYDLEIEKKLGPELRNKYRMQKLFNRPWLINFLVGFSETRPGFRSWMGSKL